MVLSFLEIILLSFLLIPGFVRLILYLGKLDRSYRKYDSIIYGLLLGGTAFSLSIIIATSLGYTLPTQVNLESIGFLAPFFLLEMSLSVFLGILGGFSIDRFIRKNYDKVNVPIWENVLTGTKNPKRVRIITEDNREIFGEIRSFGNSPLNKDLLVDYPQIRERNSEGKIVNRINKEGSLYLPEEKYRRIYIDSDIDLN